MPFDVDGAKKAGYSDAEIADYLAKGSNYDADGARKAGYTDAQIIGHLSMKEVPKEAPKPQGFGAQLSAALDEIPRQVGLTARYGIEGATGVLGFPVDPILSATGLPTVAGGGVQLSNMIGLPKPRNKTERIVGDASRMLAGAGGIVGASQKGAKAVGGVAGQALKSMAANPAAQLTSAASAGGASAYSRETGGGDGANLLSALGGAVIGGSLPALSSGVLNAIKGAMGALSGKTHAMPPNLDVRISQIIEPQLKQAGMTWDKVPANVKNAIRADAAQALKLGSGLDDDAIRRLADYRLTGLTPTRGSVTQNPAIITQERNIAKASANMADGGLPAIQNRNMHQLVTNLDDLGAPRATDGLSTGSRIVETIKGKDARAQQYENALYQSARDSSGRAAPLDRASFVNRADELLAMDGKHAFLPDAIKSKMNQIARGQIESGGKSYDVPFNVDVINSLKTELATAQRATADGNVKRAIGLVRQALDETPIEAGAPDFAMKAFDKARAFARARRSWQESAPAITDALDGIPPDRFVEQYIIGQTGKASAGSVAKLADELRKAGAKDSVKDYLVSYLKRAATGDAADMASADAARFSAAGYNKALNQLGDAKLNLFFSAEELAKLKAIGRAAKYETAQPTGSAVNNSNTAGTLLAQTLDAIGSSKLISRIPFGDAALRQPAQNWAVQIRANQAQNIAPGLAMPGQAQPIIPGAALVPPALIGPGLLGGNR